MFNWLVTIFMLASLVVLFAAWTRAIRARDSMGAEVQADWSILRIMVFVALLAEIVLLILALIGLKVAFAWIASIFLIYFSVVFLWTVNFFMTGMGTATTTTPPADLGKKATDMKSSVSVILGMAESLRDQGADSTQDLREVSETIITSAKQLSSQLDDLSGS